MPHYLYILYSSTIGKFYIGITTDIEKRIHYHNTNRSRYTKNKGPWHLVHAEPCETKQAALKREKDLKSWKSPRRLIQELRLSLEDIGSSDPVVTG